MTELSPRKLYRFSLDAYYASVDGLITAHPEDIEFLMGLGEVYFGEVAGKHSEVVAEFTTDNLELIDVADEVVLQLEAIGKNCRDRWTPVDSFAICGFSPFNFIEELERDVDGLLIVERDY